jgi:hypothetical protein
VGACVVEATNGKLNSVHLIPLLHILHMVMYNNFELDGRRG